MKIVMCVRNRKKRQFISKIDFKTHFKGFYYYFTKKSIETNFAIIWRLVYRKEFFLNFKERKNSVFFFYILNFMVSLKIKN
jgi:hypothetical protein